MNELPRKIIDCFVFNDELDVLEIRLSLLSPYVNLFVLIESNRTFDGQDKPFYYEENKERFKEFVDKILYIKVEDMPTEGGESYQRNAMSDTIHYLHKQDNLDLEDIVLISNVNEVPEMVKLTPHLHSNSFSPPFTLDMKFNQSYIKGTIIATVQEILSLGVLYLRDQKNKLKSHPNGRLFNGKK